jgi:exosortase H (IPTLxxWG-CTERM-specific)
MLALQADVFRVLSLMLRFFVLFMGLLVAMFSFRITEFAHEYFTLPFTSVLAAVSTNLITLFDKDVLATGDVIQSLSTGFAVQIAPGCDGIEAVIILIAALGAFPAPWRFKLYGAVIGFFAIQALNIVRIISLFYLGQWDRHWFDWFHLYLWQALIILDALGVWLIWLRYLPKPARTKPASGTSA